MTTTRPRLAPLLVSALALLAQCGTPPNRPSASTAGDGGATAAGASTASGGVFANGAGRAGGSSGAPASRAGSGGRGSGGASVGAGGVSAGGASGGSVAGRGALAGFGGSSGLGSQDDSDAGVTAGTLTLASSAVPTNGAFPDANTCAGADTSPDLQWTPGLGQAQSYAVMLADAATNVPQWIVWDIPASTTSLPAGIAPGATLAAPAGAKQASSSNSGYVGPCPNGSARFYEFTIFALPVATLAGVTLESSPSAIATAINLTPPLEVAFFGASAGMMATQ